LFYTGRSKQVAVMIRIKRVYDEPDEAEGLRILVDRL
jgi:uncharacterized protein YeaO (DUF488 family)